MASSPESVQINAEEYDKEGKKVASRLAGTLNNWLLTVSDIFNKRLTFGENFSGDSPTVRVQAETAYTFKYRGPGVPRLLLIGNIQNVTLPGEIRTAAVSLPQWSQDGRGNITIQPIPGLTSGHKYDITLIITTG